MNYKKICDYFNIEINNHQLYVDAFTHSSFANERKNGIKDYERLEFIGDRVLSMMIAELIFDYFPNMNQGKMTKLKISLENGAILPKYAKRYGFEDVIRLGNGQIKSGGANDKILEDVFEAFIGALYKDQGFEKTKAIIEYIFLEGIFDMQNEDLTDYKSRLQEYLQANMRGNIKYNVLEETGTAQDKHFLVEVVMFLEDGTELKLGRGEGRNKKIAEENAAKDALSKKAGN